MPRPPLVAVIGKKHSGKTTVTVQLCAELRRRGHRVMTIKHGTHTFNIDPSTTDTYRHYHEGGAERVAMAAPDKFALVARWGDELGPEEIAEEYLSDADIVVCEGFKRSELPKIEVFRPAAHDTPLFDAASPDAARYVAIVTDATAPSFPVPVLQLSDAGWLGRLAELVEQQVMRHA
ncbi:MAG TPA: molybdopterin-guanine dinucleotide biosynthesis protein B [Gemmatimonadaceae bacterium]|nr:molybdopterin-guanine dinucleotide biosynthesis protein B [Gemmatimonadaceae bacterium]